MNIALTHIQAAASACNCSRNAFVRALVLGCAVACASVPALAGPDRDRDGQQNPPQQQAQPAAREQPRERMAPPPQQAQPQQRGDMQRAEPRPSEGRGYDTRAEEQRRQAQQQQQQQQQDQGARRPGGRLTPDERRELRRQINEAGMDLYPNTPRR